MTKKRDYFWWIIVGFLIGIPVLNQLFWMMIVKLNQIFG